METQIKPINEDLKKVNTPGLQLQVKMRSTPLNKWLSDKELSERLSGTLRKSARIGMKHNILLEHEAICQTLGWAFEVAPTTRINFNDAITEGDCHSLTEAGWHIDRIISSWIWPEDQFECKYIIIDDMDCGRREGVGIVCKSTSVQWVGNGKLVFALIAEYDAEKKSWKEAVNPF